MTVSHDSSVRYDDVSLDDRDALLRMHAALRRVIAVHGMIQPDNATLDAYTDEFNRLADSMERHPRGRPFLRFLGRMPEEDPNAAIPFSPMTGRYSAMALPLEMHVEGKILVGTGVYNEAYEGPNHCVHGGMVSAIYDQILSLANVLYGIGGPTGYLHVTYKKPTPLHVPLRFEAWTESADGRKIITKGRCLVDGEVVTEAEGLFISLDPSRSYPQWSNRAQTYTPDTSDAAATHDGDIASGGSSDAE